MRFRGIRSVEQTDKKFRRIQVCLEEKQNKPGPAQAPSMAQKN